VGSRQGHFESKACFLHICFIVNGISPHWWEATRRLPLGSRLPLTPWPLLDKSSYISEKVLAFRLSTPPANHQSLDQ
jgi:hypothetical protein